MKCVCKVLIYHPPKTQHFIIIWRCCSRPWMLWGSAPHKRENIKSQEWLILPPFVVGGLVIIHSIDANWRIRVIKLFQCLYRSKFFLLKIDLHLGFAHRQTWRILAGGIRCFMVNGLVTRFKSWTNRHQPTSCATTTPLQCRNPSCFTAQCRFEMRLQNG